MIEMPRRYKYVVQDRDRHGNLRTYLRVPGKAKVRLRVEYDPNNPDPFDEEYRRALEAKPAPKKQPIGAVASGSIDALCVAYYGTGDFKGLDARTQRVRRGILDRYRAKHGHKPAARLEPRHLVLLGDQHGDTPEAYNGLLKALRAVFRAGVLRGLVKDNPAAAVPYLRSKNPDGFHSWTLEEVEQFEAHWPVGSKPRLALALLLYTAQRRSDVVLLGRQMVRDGVLTFTQQKNRARKPVQVTIPVIPELQRIIAASQCGDLTFLTTEHGGPYSPDSFGNAFRRWCRAAGLPQCSPHGLRKAAAARLADLGCSAHEIMAVTGHRTIKEVIRYTDASDRKRMAGAAFARLSAEQSANEKSHSGAATPEWDENATQPIDAKGEVEWMVPRAGIEPATLRFSVACSTN